LIVGSKESTVDSKLSPIDSKLCPIDSELQSVGKKFLPSDSNLCAIDKKVMAIGNKLCAIDANECTIDKKLWRSHNKFSRSHSKFARTHSNAQRRHLLLRQKRDGLAKKHHASNNQRSVADAINPQAAVDPAIGAWAPHFLVRDYAESEVAELELLRRDLIDSIAQVTNGAASQEATALEDRKKR